MFHHSFCGLLLDGYQKGGGREDWIWSSWALYLLSPTAHDSLWCYWYCLSFSCNAWTWQSLLASAEQPGKWNYCPYCHLFPYNFFFFYIILLLFPSIEMIHLFKNNLLKWIKTASLKHCCKESRSKSLNCWMVLEICWLLE